MGLGRSSSLRIGGDSSTVVGSGRTDGVSYRSTGVELRDAPRALPFPLEKGKGRVDLIKYPGGLEYLKSVVQHALVVGPSKVDPSYGATFVRRYRPPFGVRVWSPDVLTSYVVSVPKMVCFFEVAFENGLRFPLHPFIKGFYNTSMSILLNFHPIAGAFWLVYCFSLGTGGSVSLV